MANLKKWLLDEADGEAIIGVVIGPMGWGDYGSESVPQYDSQRRGEVLTWDEALPFIDYEFSNGFGAPECNAVYAWTESWVIAICQYDGSTSPFKIPRNPSACTPDMPGG